MLPRARNWGGVAGGLRWRPRCRRTEDPDFTQRPGEPVTWPQRPSQGGGIGEDRDATQRASGPATRPRPPPRARGSGEIPDVNWRAKAPSESSQPPSKKAESRCAPPAPAEHVAPRRGECNGVSDQATRGSWPPTSRQRTRDWRPGPPARPNGRRAPAPFSAARLLRRVPRRGAGQG